MRRGMEVNELFGAEGVLGNWHVFSLGNSANLMAQEGSLPRSQQSTTCPCHYGYLALNVLNKQSRTADNRWSSSAGVEGEADSLRCQAIRMLHG